jgi:eukaryotic-like serine/threonine-protein kinase
MRVGVGRGPEGGGGSLACLSEDQVMAVLAGELEPGAFAAAESHLDACDLCRLLISTLAARTNDGNLRRGPLCAFESGDVLADRYEISALLGVGGMGEVYAALDRVLGESIALKTLAPDPALGDNGVARLKTEVQFARRVTHRNVCRVFDVGFHVESGAGRRVDPSTVIPFFTMELLAGETLRSHLRRRGPSPPTEVRDLVEQMAAGLDAAHAVGVVHRDFKSENVMLVPERGRTRVVITDFGLAHSNPPASVRSEGRPVVAGTFGYMAPEQLSGRPTGPATDVYALGVVAFELLTGSLPVPPAPAAHEAIPRHWEAAIRRCLDAAPEARFQSAAELMAALRSPPPRVRPGRRSAQPARIRETLMCTSRSIRR